MKNELIATYTDLENGIAFEVVSYHQANGWMIAVKDIDANEYYDSKKIYPAAMGFTLAKVEAIAAAAARMPEGND
jgi:hypothetical protein